MGNCFFRGRRKWCGAYNGRCCIIMSRISKLAISRFPLPAIRMRSCAALVRLDGMVRMSIPSLLKLKSEFSLCMAVMLHHPWQFSQQLSCMHTGHRRGGAG